MNFALGLAIWAYPNWVGDLFPAGSRSRDFLRLYGDRFSTVEGNTTFYSIPNAEMVQRWVQETPESFQFCLKLPRLYTHDGPLMAHLEGALKFIDDMRALGTRLGPLFAQLPPTYSPAAIQDLEAFLTQLPRQTTEFAVEVRHPAWFQPPHDRRLNAMLESLGIGRVLLDTRPIYDDPSNPQRDSQRKKPQLPLQPCVTAPFTLIRYISNPEQSFNQPYLQEWVTRCQDWLTQGTRIYFFVHCPIEERSPTNAKYFQTLLEEAGVEVPPLPWSAIAPPPAQLSLF